MVFYIHQITLGTSQAKICVENLLLYYKRLTEPENYTKIGQYAKNFALNT